MTYYQQGEKLVRIVSAAIHTDEDRWDLDWVMSIWEDAVGHARELYLQAHEDEPIPTSWFTSTEILGTNNMFTLPELSVLNGEEYLNVFPKKGCANTYLFKNYSQYCNAKGIDCDANYNSFYIKNGTLQYTGLENRDKIIVEGVFKSQAALSSFNPMVDNYNVDSTISDIAMGLAVKWLNMAASRGVDTVSNSVDNLNKPVPQ